MNALDSTRLLALPGHDSPVGAPRSILDWLEDNARRFGDCPALLGIDRPATSHADLYRQVRDIAAWLNALGLGRGDLVCICLGNGPEALALILATGAAAVAFVHPPEEPVEFLESVLGRTPAKALVYDGSRPGCYPGLCARLGLLPLAMWIDPNQPAGHFRLQTEAAPGALPGEPTRIDDTAVLARTSGTTSEPRLIAWSQASIFRSADTAATWMGLDASDRSLCVMPLASLHSVVRSSLPVLLRGGSVVCAPGFDKVRIQDWIETYRPSFMTAAPAIYRATLARAVETGRTLRGSSLRFLAAGSDRLGWETAESIAQGFGVPVREFYGMNEVAPMLAATEPGRLAQQGGAVGPALKPWSLEIRDPSGCALPCGVEGEIAAHGGLFNPVLSDTEGRSGRIVEGWYLTGDLGLLDKRGHLHVTGRADERINRGGKKIAPATVESTLLGHPAVAQAVVFPVPDVLLGQRVAALVVPRPDARPAPLDLRSFVAARLPDFMVPERIDLADSIPHTGLGKVARNGLAQVLGIAGIETPTQSISRTRADTHTEAVLQGLLRELLDLKEVDLGADFMDLGGDSYLAVALLEGIDARLGVFLSPAQFLANANVIALAQLIDSLKGDTAPPLIFAVQPEGDRPPLFITHSPAGYAYYAHFFAKYLGPDQPVYAFQLQTPPAGVALTMENHAARYVAAMRAIQPHGPYCIMGHSAGAHLAFECAQQLAAAGERIDFLGLVDDEADLFKRHFGARTEEDNGASTFNRFHQVLTRYVPRLYPGKVHLFCAEVTMPERLADSTVGWGELALGGVELIEVPGDHITMMGERTIRQWAPILRDYLTKCVEGASGAAAWTEARARAATRCERPDYTASVRARECAKGGDLDGEIECYRQAIAVDGEQPYWVYRNLGAALYQRGRHAEALEHYRAALTREETPIMGRIELARALAGLGRGDEARAELAAAEASAADRFHGLFAVGQAWRTLDEPLAAERCLRRVIEEKPHHCLAREQLSDALVAQGRGEDAVSMALAVLDYRPDRDSRVVGRARQFAALGHTGPARGLIEGLIALRPRHGAAHLQLSELLDREGDLQGATAMARRALELGADPIQCRIRLGGLLLRQGLHADAEPWLREARGLAPDDSAVLHRLGLALEGMGRIDDALVVAREATALDPRRGDLAARVGVLLWGQGDLASAEQHLQQAVDLGHRAPGVYRMLSQVALRTGRDSLALELAQQALDLAPQDPALREHLEGIRRRLDRPAG